MADETKMTVKIDGDSSGLNKAIEETDSKTEALGERLKGIAAASSIAFGAISGITGYAVKQFGDMEKVQAQLNNTLEATKFAAGVSATEVNNLAESLSKETTFSKEAVVGSQNLILSFDKIGKDIFPKASKVALDLAAKFGGDLPQATLVLSKALQYPVEGLGQLARAGIRFSEDEKKVFQSMVDGGHAAEAQALILKRVADFTQGAAAAAAKTYEGRLAQLKNQFNELAISIGEKFEPGLAAVTEKLSEFVAKIQGSKEIQDFIFGLLKMASALTGIAAVTFGTISIISKLYTTLQVLNGAFGVAAGGARLFAGATGLGLVALAIAYTITHYDELVNATTAAFFAVFASIQSIYESIKTTLLAIGEGLKAAISGDLDGIIAAFNKTNFNLIDIGRQAGLAAKKAYAEGKVIGQAFVDKANDEEKRKEQAHLDELEHMRKVKLQADADAELAAINAASQKSSQMEDIESQMAQDLLNIDDELGNNQVNEYNSTTGDLVNAARERASELEGIEGSSTSSGGFGGGEPSGGGGGLGVLEEDSPAGRAARASLRSNPSLWGNYAPGISASDLIKAVIRAISTKGIAFAQGFSGENIQATFNGGEFVIPKTFAQGITDGKYALTAAKEKGRGRGRQTVDLKVGFDGREAARVITTKQNRATALGISRFLS